MVTTFYPPYSFGGDAIFVRRLSNGLAERGHKVDVIHCIDSYRLLAGGEPEEAGDDHPNVTVHGIRSPMGRLSPLATQQTGLPLFKSKRIRQVLKKGFDVIHYHNISLLGPGVLGYGRAVKLYTMHEYWLICPTHVLFKYNRAACAEPRCLTCSLVHRRPPQWWRYSSLLDNAIRHVDAFIAASHFGKEAHLRMKPDLPIVHLPNFAPFAPPPGPLDCDVESSPFFLFVGRLEKLKGLQTIIPLFRRYEAAKLLIAGAGSYEAELRRLAEGSSNIRFLGHLSEGQLQNLYPRAVALLVPSLCFEVFPLVILEAFRQHTPVIARNIGGLPEIIRESGGGLAYGTEEELTAAIDNLMADRRYRDDLGLLGYQAYERNWTVQAHLDRYFALIRKFMPEKSGATELHSTWAF
jgi:glycosyltransferase involved in cell wall biosynthesis